MRSTTLLEIGSGASLKLQSGKEILEVWNTENAQDGLAGKDVIYVNLIIRKFTMALDFQYFKN